MQRKAPRLRPSIRFHVLESSDNQRAAKVELKLWQLSSLPQPGVHGQAMVCSPCRDRPGYAARAGTGRGMQPVQGQAGVCSRRAGQDGLFTGGGGKAAGQVRRVPCCRAGPQTAHFREPSDTAAGLRSGRLGRSGSSRHVGPVRRPARRSVWHRIPQGTSPTSAPGRQPARAIRSLQWNTAYAMIHY